MLRQMTLGLNIASKRSELSGLIAKRTELETRKKTLEERAEKLKAAYEEVREDTPADDRETLDKELRDIEAEAETLDKDVQENAESISGLEKNIRDMETELNEINAKAEAANKENETGATPENGEGREEKGVTTMKTRFFKGLSIQQRDAMFAREDMKSFAQRIRQLGKEKRAISGGELLIPEIMLPLLREVVEESSKLLKHVNVQHVGGTAREAIMGTIPEAVWTEMCANLNELSLSFSEVEVDGYKVGGFISVCNALLEDNDVNLVDQVMYAIGRAIGLSLDKAILYGTGTKMPMGIVTRLAQTAAPADYPVKAREWADLHATNIVSITAANSTGTKLFQSILNAFGNAKSKYGAGGKFWAMNEKTKAKLVAEALTINAAGAIVSSVENSMPVLGGAIEELEFVPDNVIVAGYGELYLLAERAGTALASSEHFLFASDKTVFKGTARYDGTPVIAEGFVAIGINAATVNADAVTFAADTANS